MNNNINVKLNPPQGIRVEDKTVYVYDNSSIGDGILTIQKNSETIDTFTANSKVDKTVNITVPTQASDIGALPDTTVIPTVNDATLTIQKNGSNVATFTANSSSNATANITVPTKTSDLTNDDGFITGISSSDITTALGYTPVNGSSLATVATSGSYNDLSNKPTIPTVNNPTITFTQGGVEKGSITLNQSSNETIALDAGGGGSLPSQTGNAGKFLTTDGTDPSWASITIPTVNDATLTIQKNGTSVATFTANSSTNQTANITVPTTVAELTDSSNYVLSSSLSSVATSGLYSDLTGTPTIPTVNNSTITITQGGVNKGSFTLNQSSGDTIALDAGADANLSNLTATGKATGASLAMPTSTYDDLILGVSGTEYTAPASGWFFITINGTAGNYFYMRNKTASYLRGGGAIGNRGMDVFIPANSGDIMTILYNGTITVENFRFIYAVGEI